jgi:hypothetical protein
MLRTVMPVAAASCSIVRSVAIEPIIRRSM